VVARQMTTLAEAFRAQAAALKEAQEEEIKCPMP
jgi:hypothetical protein